MIIINFFLYISYTKYKINSLKIRHDEKWKNLWKYTGDTGHAVGEDTDEVQHHLQGAVGRKHALENHIFLL